MDKTLVLRAGQIQPAGLRAGQSRRARSRASTNPACRRGRGVGRQADPRQAARPSGGNAGKELEFTKALTTIGKPGVPGGGDHAGARTATTSSTSAAAAAAVAPVVNGAEIDLQARKLAHNDTIELAGTTMSFLVVG